MSINEWKERLAAVSKRVRHDAIYRAHVEGGMSYAQIADALGDITRNRVLQIVRQERDRREQ
jgi:hypothetical protein